MKKEQVIEHWTEKTDKYIPDFLDPHRKFMGSQVSKGNMEMMSFGYMLLGIAVYFYTGTVWAIIPVGIALHLAEYILWYLEQQGKYKPPLEKVMEDKM